MVEATKPGEKAGRFPVRAGTLAVLGALGALAVYPFFGTTYMIGVLTEIMILAIFALSLGFLMGYPKLISLGHAAFFGGGAYAAGIVAVRLEAANLFLTLVCALVFATLLAVLIGVLSLRNTGIYFLMITLALAQLVYVVAEQWTWLTGGTDGLVGIPYPELFGFFSFDRFSFYYLVLLLAGGAYFLLRLVTRSPFGHVLLGIGSNERRMRAIGYGTRVYKLAAFVLSGAVAGVAGALWAHYNGIVAPVDVNWPLSATALIMVIVGGAGTLVGPMLGAAVVWFLDTGLSSYTERSTMIMGAVFILFVFFARGGIAGIARSLWERFYARTGT
ncbi:branched-chain amino acid ABC transporter permease [Rubrobacter taiwanensis]|jgi:branched-chain amino acid transport system permease protein|uniref:Branched-chain amino acid ABC transporter permease n=1 Tax=Rubrobacter taiwanensis TaxID=185139 RepID=A0A4R1BCT0_9ACTN|nr:branched-chain amino acid ABC transporter permease [Rubrobacter taiwanensis]TCJ14843.1 branched-chain amino acid ABC transporter permease [Rubrobacter taiwanensis]